MQIKIKHITLALFLIDAILLIVNSEYQDETASVNPDLDTAKGFFFIGVLCFVTFLIIAKSKEALAIATTIAIIAFGFSLFFNLRLAKDNYDRIKCNNGISEYFEYFEYESCSKIEERFATDVRNNEIKYFQQKYDSDLEFEERLREEHGIELIGIHCTGYTSMNCYNDLVIDYLKKKNIKWIIDYKK